MASVRVPATMRRDTGGRTTVVADGATLAQALEAVTRECPALTTRLFDTSGQLQRYVAVFINDCDIRSLDGLATPLRETDEVQIISAIAGG